MAQKFVIRKAEKKRARLRLGLCGPSGSGKTYSALELAKGLVDGTDGKICVIDTERHSAELYADLCSYDVLPLESPYSPENYMMAIRMAEKHVGPNGVVVIDQISHAWAGEGGLLEYVDALKQTARNGLSPWAHATPEQNRFVETILGAKCHVIATMRSKVEWVLETVEGRNGTKSTKPRKVGMAPVQRDGIEYEFTTMLDIDAESHAAVATKDRSRLFARQVVVLNSEWGRKLREWLESGADDPDQPAASGPGQQQSLPGTEGRAEPAADRGPAPTEGKRLTIESRILDMQLAMREANALPEVAMLYERFMGELRGWKANLDPNDYRDAVSSIVSSKNKRKDELTAAASKQTANA